MHDGRDSGVATVTSDIELGKKFGKKLDPDNAGMVALVELIQEQEGITIDSMAQKILQNEPNLCDPSSIGELATLLPESCRPEQDSHETKQEPMSRESALQFVKRERENLRLLFERTMQAAQDRVETLKVYETAVAAAI